MIFTPSSVVSLIFWEGPNILILSQQQYLFWDTAPRNARGDTLMLEIWE